MPEMGKEGERGEIGREGKEKSTPQEKISTESRDKDGKGNLQKRNPCQRCEERGREEKSEERGKRNPRRKKRYRQRAETKMGREISGREIHDRDGKEKSTPQEKILTKSRDEDGKRGKRNPCKRRTLHCH